MAVLTQSPRFDYTLTAGSASDYTVTLAQSDGVTPYVITSWTWEYAVRASATDTSASPLIKITTTSGTQGLLTVETTPLSVVTVQVYPAATAIGTLTPGTYWHSLWANPGTTTQLCVYQGLFTVIAAAEP